ILERLEIVIREIAFSHNYYGAYFVNEVSRAKNYQRKTKRLRLSLKAMAKAMPFFIRMNYVEQDDRRHLVNITNNYSALYELDYIVPKYSKGSYADLIQSVLSLLVESSAKDVQTLGMMNRPNPEVEKKHNIGFITAIVNMSGFSKLARFIRDYISPNKEDIFESSKAKKIMEWLNKELSTNENIEYLKDILTRLSIKDYEALWGLIDYLENKDIDFKTSLSKTVGNLLYLMANNELPLKEIFRMVSFFEIKNLTEVNIEIPTPFLEILSDILLRLSEGHKKELVSFWKTEHLHSLLTKTNNLTANSFSVRLANKKALQNILLNYQDAIIKNGLTQEDYFYRLFDLLLEEDQEKVSLLHNMLE